MIREPFVSEAKHLVALGAATGLFSPSEADTLLRGTLDDFFAGRLGPNHRVVVAAVEPTSEPLGWAYFAENHHAPGVWELLWIGVAPAAQRRGVGSELLAFVEQHVRASGARVLVIETSTLPRLEGARRFYTRHHYVASGRIMDFYGPGDGKQTYTKAIAPGKRTDETSAPDGPRDGAGEGARAVDARWGVEGATVEDVAEVVRLLRAQFDEHAIALDEGALRDAVVALLRTPERGGVLLARDDGRPIGVAVLATTWTLEHGGLVAWLDELFVVPEERGRGAGRALLNEAMRRARAQGCLALELEVDETHARAENLYERAGFTRLARRRWQRGIAPATTSPSSSRPTT